MYYQGFSNADLSVEAIVARNMGDEDWEDLIDDSPTLAAGCARRATNEPERDGRFEPEPVTVKSQPTFKALITRRRV